MGVQRWLEAEHTDSTELPTARYSPRWSDDASQRSPYFGTDKPALSVESKYGARRRADRGLLICSNDLSISTIRTGNAVLAGRPGPAPAPQWPPSSHALTFLAALAKSQ